MILVISLIVLLVGIFTIRNYMKGNQCNLQNRIDGKIVLITGSNTGIGFETALELANRGALVHMACRNEEKCFKAKNDIVKLSGVDANKIFCHKLDLASFQSILDFSQKFKSQVTKLDILINNAGVILHPYDLTKDGFEMHMGINHIGTWLLTKELLDLIKLNGGGRIINISSLAHTKASLTDLNLNSNEADYHRRKAYAKSKLANVLHARYLAKELYKDEVAVVSLHPGVVSTNLGGNLTNFQMMVIKIMSNILIKKPNEGAQTTLYCALLPDLIQYTGQYFSDCCVKLSSNSQAYNDDLAKKFNEATSQVVQKRLLQMKLN